jgi:hypothetical protein
MRMALGEKNEKISEHLFKPGLNDKISYNFHIKISFLLSLTMDAS